MAKVSLFGLVSGKLGDVVMYAFLPRLYHESRTDSQNMNSYFLRTTVLHLVVESKGGRKEKSMQ